MKRGTSPTVILTEIETQESAVRYGKIESDIMFDSEQAYVNAFKEMSENISDDTLIEILRERDEEYVSEEYR